MRHIIGLPKVENGIVLLLLSLVCKMMHLPKPEEDFIDESNSEVERNPGPIAKAAIITLLYLLRSSFNELVILKEQ